jgi:hypothetical protein
MTYLDFIKYCEIPGYKLENKTLTSLDRSMTIKKANRVFTFTLDRIIRKNFMYLLGNKHYNKDSIYSSEDGRSGHEIDSVWIEKRIYHLGFKGFKIFYTDGKEPLNVGNHELQYDYGPAEYYLLADKIDYITFYNENSLFNIPRIFFYCIEKNELMYDWPDINQLLLDNIDNIRDFDNFRSETNEEIRISFKDIPENLWYLRVCYLELPYMTNQFYGRYHNYSSSTIAKIFKYFRNVKIKDFISNATFTQEEEPFEGTVSFNLDGEEISTVYRYQPPYRIVPDIYFAHAKKLIGIQFETIAGNKKIVMIDGLPNYLYSESDNWPEEGQKIIKDTSADNLFYRVTNYKPIDINYTYEEELETIKNIQSPEGFYYE